jgi:hypothetical protein
MNYLDFFEATILNNGATYNPLTNELNNNKGYLVSLPKFEQRIEKHNFSVQHIKDYINCNFGTFSENLSVGSWVDNGIVYLDVTESILNIRNAVNIAYLRGQKAIYDANSGKIIELPTPQKSGTETQKKAYITTVIDKLCQNI